MVWSPSPAPEEPINPGTGWSPEGPDMVALDPVTGWWVKQQLLGIAASHAEFQGELGVHLRANMAATAVFPAALVVHLIGIAAGRGGFEGGTEVSDADIKLYLFGVASSSATFTATANFHYRVDGTYPTVAAFTAALSAHLAGIAAGTSSGSAATLSHLIGLMAAVGGGDATAAFGAAGPVTTSFTTVGANILYPIPAWCRYIDLMIIGAGGGGREGNGGTGAAGNGGLGGTWRTLTLERGVDIPWFYSNLRVTIPAGGVAGAKGAGDVTTSSKGGDALVTTDGSPVTTLLSAPGGNGGSGTGGVAGSGTSSWGYEGMSVTGANSAPSGSGRTVGNPPGGGGGGGAGGIFNTQTAGMAGARGQGAVQARQ